MAGPPSVLCATVRCDKLQCLWLDYADGERQWEETGGGWAAV